MLNNNNTLFNYKFIFEKFLKNQNFNASISRIKNYCILLNNNKSIIKKFKLSRYKIKLMAANGLLIGLKKSSF